MARILKCDRCGVVYPTNNNDLGRYHIIGANMKCINTVTAGNHDEETIDLCDECWVKFYKWMEGDKND